MCFLVPPYPFPSMHTSPTHPRLKGGVWKALEWLLVLLSPLVDYSRKSCVTEPLIKDSSIHKSKLASSPTLAHRVTSQSHLHVCFHDIIHLNHSNSPPIILRLRNNGSTLWKRWNSESLCKSSHLPEPSTSSTSTLHEKRKWSEDVEEENEIKHKMTKDDDEPSTWTIRHYPLFLASLKSVLYVCKYV